MWLTDRTDSSEIKPTSHRLVITLRVAQEGNPIVRSSELIGLDYRIRTSFLEEIPVEEVFVQPIADQLKACLSEAGTQTELTYFPDIKIATPGLMLSGISSMISSNENNTLHVIFRFRHFDGTFNRAFRKNLRLDDRLNVETQRLEAPAISDLAVPILNICEAARYGLSNAKAPAADDGNKLAQRAEEIALQIDLVEQLVSQLDSVSVVAEKHDLDGEAEPKQIPSSKAS